MRNYLVITGILVFGIFGLKSLNAQIYSPEADFVDTTDYRIDQVNDSIFVFYSPEDDIKGILRAEGIGSGSFDFNWSRYDTIAKSWNLFFSESSVSSSELQDLEEGGYRVDISNGTDVDTTFRCWIHLNGFKLDVLYDLINGPPKAFCGALILNAEINIDSFYYYNFLTEERILRDPELNYLWSADTDFTVYNASIGYSSKTISDPPYEDTWFTLVAGDYSGMQDRDSLLYESIEVNAEYSMQFYDKEDTEEFVEADSYEESAPLTVLFTNESVNGVSYEWIFSDTTGTYGSGFFANLETDDIFETPEFTYQIPDDYYPKLVATSEEGCVDTFNLDEPLTVLPSELEAPNVFSPEGLEANRYFKVSFQSIKEFHLRIYTRTGNLVYKVDVTDMYSWDGWNGNIMNSNRPAPAGAYYYVIEATGYDEVQYNKGVYKGVVYLFRPKN